MSWLVEGPAITAWGCNPGEQEDKLTASQSLASWLQRGTICLGEAVLNSCRQQLNLPVCLSAVPAWSFAGSEAQPMHRTDWQAV